MYTSRKHVVVSSITQAPENVGRTYVSNFAITIARDNLFTFSGIKLLVAFCNLTP